MTKFDFRRRFHNLKYFEVGFSRRRLIVVSKNAPSQAATSLVRVRISNALCTDNSSRNVCTSSLPSIHTTK